MRTALTACVLLAIAAGTATACGGRSDLHDPPDSTAAAGGQGGAATTSTTASTGTGMTTSTGGGGPVDCMGLSLATPIVLAPSPGFARAPQLARLPPANDVMLSFLDEPEGEAGVLLAGRADAFGAWPPAFDDLTPLDTGVIAYVTGPGPSGPVGLLHHSGFGATLAAAFFPQIEGIDAPLSAGDEILFAAGIPDRYLVGQRTFAPSYAVLDLSSYQTGSLPQSEDPLVCLTSPVLAAGIPSGTGFLAAYLEPDPPEPSCNPGAPHAGTVVSVSRYEAPPGNGTFLERTQGLRFVNGEPAVHLALAPASFGGWVVFQMDGSTSRIPPPVVAARLDPAGNALAKDELIAVSPGGAVVPAVSVAALGDTLAVAWIDAIDPSAPVIAIQLVHPDGSLGAATSIPTNEAWYTGGLQLLPSAAQDSLLLAWETFEEDGRVALARLDCLNTF